MASVKIIAQKAEVVERISSSIKNSESVILFSYQGLNVSEIENLRRKLREVDSEVKIYKNTLLKRALDELNITMDEFLAGPNALLFGKTLLEPIKIISDFAKQNDKMEIRVGILSGEVSDINVIKEYAMIPSRDGLLTMLAGGMIQYVRDLSIALNLYSEQLPSELSETVASPQVEEATKDEVVEDTTETTEEVVNEEV